MQPCNNTKIQNKMSDNFITDLKSRLEGELPGVEAQYNMAHAVRRSYNKGGPEYRTACVLALFYPKDDEWYMVFIERTSNNNPNDRHKGQIGFPGGKVEAIDKTLEDTALREAWEEVGIPAEEVTILGRLTELHIPVSKFVVHPFVGYMNRRPDFVRQPSEVARILEVPFSTFLKHDTYRRKDVMLRPQVKLREVPYFDVDGTVIWGATAMMLGELMAVMEFEVLEALG